MKKVVISNINDVLLQNEISKLETHRAEFKEHRCVANARLVCNLLGYECIEGLILVVLNSCRYMRYCRHCWNMTKEGNHFDVTSEYCFPKQPDEIYYFALKSCNEEDYTNLEIDNPTRVFCSDAVLCVAECNFELDMDELKKLEKDVLDRGRELKKITDEDITELSPKQMDKKLQELRDKNDKCKEAFTKYKKKINETIECLTNDLSQDEKQMFQEMSNDIMRDITSDITRSRLQKLEDLKNAVLPYL